MQIDGSVPHMAAVGIAIGSTIIRPVRRKLAGHGFHFVMQEVLYDSLSALAIVPFVLIVGSVFSSELLKEALTYNSDLMAVSGFWGLIAVLTDLFKRPERPKTPGPGGR
jgi:hypothetical protein